MTDTATSSEARLAELLRSPKRRRFAIAYAENGGNGTQAGEAAGFAHPREEAYRLLQDDAVREAIAVHTNIMCRVAGETRETVFARMIDRANADPCDIWLDNEETRAEFTAAGLKHPADMPRGLRKSIKSISFTQHGPKVDFYPADAADRDIANLMSLFAKEDTALTADDAASLIAAALDRMDELDAPEHTGD